MLFFSFVNSQLNKLTNQRESGRFVKTSNQNQNLGIAESPPLTEEDLPKWVSLVKTETRVNNHCNPKSNKDEKSNDISAFSVVLNDSTHLSNSIT